jgi:monoamine oxidase
MQNVMVIGAGVSGLYSAYLLVNLGFRVTVLEARDRVGGRTYSVDGIDLGGSWVSTQQPHVYKLCQDFDLELIPQYETGRVVVSMNGDRVVYDKAVTTAVEGSETSQINKYVKIFDKWAEELNLESEFYKQLDYVSVPDWLKENVHDKETIDFFNFFISTISTTNQQRISMLFFLFFLKQGRGFDCLYGNSNGAQEFRVVGGTQTISHKLAQSLDVRLNQVVTQVIRQEDGRYQILTKDQQTYTADLVLCAIPANLISHICWSPLLEKERLALYQGMKMGMVTKLVAVYEKPFWRDNNYSGECLSNTPPVQVCLDGSGTDYFALIIFVTHIYDEYINYTNEAILNHLAMLLNNKLALTPTKIYRKDWQDDPFSQGCYFSVPRIGDAKLYKYLSQPFGNIYFAGTETANEWYGYIDGAVESAIRVVEQIKSKFIDK